MKRRKVYVGVVCNATPHFYRDQNYYDGVRKADLFASKKEARKCYEKVLEAELVIQTHE